MFFKITLSKNVKNVPMCPGLPYIRNMHKKTSAFKITLITKNYIGSLIITGNNSNFHTVTRGQAPSLSPIGLEEGEI